MKKKNLNQYNTMNSSFSCTVNMFSADYDFFFLNDFCNAYNIYYCYHGITLLKNIFMFHRFSSQRKNIKFFYNITYKNCLRQRTIQFRCKEDRKKVQAFKFCLNACFFRIFINCDLMIKTQI